MGTGSCDLVNGTWPPVAKAMAGEARHHKRKLKIVIQGVYIKKGSSRSCF
jgi:nitrogen fixation protein FixH